MNQTVKKVEFLNFWPSVSFPSLSSADSLDISYCRPYLCKLSETPEQAKNLLRSENDVSLSPIPLPKFLKNFAQALSLGWLHQT